MYVYQNLLMSDNRYYIGMPILYFNSILKNIFTHSVHTQFTAIGTHSLILTEVYL